MMPTAKAPATLKTGGFPHCKICPNRANNNEQIRLKPLAENQRN